jgi:hypothetical protein
MAAKRGANERNRRRREAKKREEDALNAAYYADQKRNILAHSSISITEVMNQLFSDKR